VRVGDEDKAEWLNLYRCGEETSGSCGCGASGSKECEKISAGRVHGLILDLLRDRMKKPLAGVVRLAS
jgi:hypothetical protein